MLNGKLTSEANFAGDELLRASHFFLQALLKVRHHTLIYQRNIKTHLTFLF